jgi:Rho family protein
VAAAIGARAYKECSALRIEGVDDVFEAATRLSMLMREGVPTHGISERSENHHKRKSSGKSGMGLGGAGEDDGPGRCCVIC